MQNAIRLTAISKNFGTVKACSNVSLSIRSGAIYAVVGENGAGKSTLARLIYGMHQPDGGSMEINGSPVTFASPGDAIAAGVGMVHQHFMLVPTLTVTENVMLGLEKQSLFSTLDPKNSAENIRQLSLKYGMAVDPLAPVSTLSVGQEQRVEILKVLYRNARILILDEPTAVLTPLETDQLFAVLRSLAKEGKTILIITHKLDEVLALADTVTVMSRGSVTGTLPCQETSKEELARMMVGRSVLLRVENPPPSPKKTMLTVENLGYRTATGIEKLEGVSFSVREGEIFGIAGVEGNGQSELLSLLWGLHDRNGRVSGKIIFEGSDITGKNPAQIAGLGVSHIPENRLKHAVISGFSVADNMIFGRHREKRFHQGFGFDRQAVTRYALELGKTYDIRCTDLENTPLGALSGGNQQKVVVARELDRPGMKLLILAQPTRGVDIGAIEQIHRSIIGARDRGAAILLVSSELDELIALSTRIGALYQGSIRRIFTREEVSEGRKRGRPFEEELGLSIT
ncbi:MAG: ABC transporter ATP-binding protein [Chlorobium sp.]|uniref:ABC transporter ATP-binding protein n=1 Tax=Chlorobium sp. TaxID=1095 RepID=UPI0025C043FD|nr:ABC transporter ATP-binding protein [Chlorobium sp.]MCF8383878.1 ABC transporter ATP-binding protein [Chlorobium sp.]